MKEAVRYIDNPNLNGVELADIRGAVNEWRKAQFIPCLTRSGHLYPTVAAARHLADHHPNLSSDLARLTSSSNPCLAFFAYLALRWAGAEEAASSREQLAKRRFPVLDGSFLVHRSLDEAVEAAELHLKLHHRPSGV